MDSCEDVLVLAWRWTWRIVSTSWDERPAIDRSKWNNASVLAWTVDPFSLALTNALSTPKALKASMASGSAPVIWSTTSCLFDPFCLLLSLFPYTKQPSSVQLALGFKNGLPVDHPPHQTVGTMVSRWNNKQWFADCSYHRNIIVSHVWSESKKIIIVSKKVSRQFASYASTTCLWFYLYMFVQVFLRRWW
jgi:hypothetical protein